jgi:cobalt-zinc-cadmium efflux system outer membrane protein
VALLSGCATVQPKGGFTEVRGLIAERLDRDVQWDQGTPEDARVRETVGRLLQNDLAVDAAVQIALLNNPTLQATYEDLGVAQADLVEAGLLKNPVFSGFTRIPHSGPPSQTNLEFDVSQEFINVLFLPARKRIAATNFEAKKLRVTNAVLELAARVRAAYYGLEAAQNLTEVLSTNAEASAASAELAGRMHEAGNLNDLDLAREKALATQLALEVERSRGDIVIAREALTRLMGLSGEEGSWTVPTALPPLPAREPSLDDLARTALTTRPDLAAARQEVDALRQGLGLTRLTRWFPFLDLGIDNERDTDGQWVTGPIVSLQLPIFNQGQADVARLEAELRRSEKGLVAIGVSARSEIREARERVMLARRLVEGYRSTLVPLRQQVVSRAMEHQNYMLIGVFDVLAAKRDEIDTYRSYVGAVRDYWVARSDLERALGTRLPAQAASSAPPTTPAPSAPAPAAQSPTPMKHEHPHEHGGR